METTTEPDWSALVGPLVAGRKVVLAGTPVAGFTEVVAWLRRLGSERVLIIGNGVGTGPLPSADDADHVLLGIDAPNPVEEFRACERLLVDPPAPVRAAIEQYDPDRTALVLLAPVQAIREVAGRPATGARDPRWVALEDKTIADALFDDAGVARPPCEVVAPELAALLAAAARLDRGAGTVWAGDAREGFNGGGVFVRWIAEDDASAAREAAGFFAARCDAVRVAPFLEGTPCSIHGMVVDDGVAVFRPVEMIVLRKGHELRTSGIATFYDPGPADREVMREAVRRVGRLLAERVGFRGSFGIDGVMTADGFRPTELNPRFGGGLATVARGAADRLPLVLLHLAIVHDPSIVSAAALEEHLTRIADTCRFGGGSMMIERRVDESRSWPIVRDGGRWRHAAPDEVADAWITLGPGAAGGYLRIGLEPERTPIGPSVAPLVASAFEFAADELGLDTAGLTPAPSVR